MDLQEFDQRFGALVSGMEPAESERFAGMLRPIDLAAGEVLITEGTDTSALYLVADGALAVAVGVGEDERDVGTVDRGSVVGEVSLLDRGPATATVRSDVGATVLELSHDQLVAFEHEHPLASSLLIERLGATLADRVRRTVRSLEGPPSPGSPSPGPAEVGSVEVGPDVMLLSADDISALRALDGATVEHHPAGHVVATAGRRRDAVHVVIEGRVASMTDLGDLLVLGVGEVDGSEALFGAVPSTGTISREDATLLRLPSAARAALRTTNPALYTRLQHVAAVRLARMLRVTTSHLGRTRRSETGSTPQTTDVAVMGGGPIGLAYAWFLKDRAPNTRITVLDRREAPGYKVGESTLGTTTRAFARMGLPFPVMRRLFGVKAGIRFWWTEPGDEELHGHIDATDIEETFQVDRRVLETLLVSSARRRGIDVRMGTRVDIGKSEIGGGGARLSCEAPGGSYDLQAGFVCDASGRAALLPRRLGLHRTDPERLATFNTNSYYAYFRQRTDPDVAFWDQPATRHICFEQGWTWFISVLSWDGTPQSSLDAMVEYLLDLPEGPDESYPTRQELEERFGATSEIVLSVGFTVRADDDTSLGQSVAGRFDHYRQRYPAVDRVLDHYDLVETPFGKRQPYSAFQRLAHDSAAVAGDGWCVVGDAAMFSNPLFSPGLNLGTGTAHEAAADTARALASGDVGQRGSFRAYQHYADRTYAALMGFNDMLYRAFADRETYERAMLMFFFHSAGDVLARETYSDTDPYIWDLLNPEFTRRVDQVRGLLLAAEESGRSAASVIGEVTAITDPYIAEMGRRLAASGMRISGALREFDQEGQRMANRDETPGAYTAHRCGTCRQWFDSALPRCVVCGSAPVLDAPVPS